MKVEYGKHFKVKVSRYTDEDFDSANNAVELEIKSSKPILKLAVEKAVSAMSKNMTQHHEVLTNVTWNGNGVVLTAI